MTVIDRRVVEMGFDNKQFERGVQTSLKSVDSLKKGLNLDESARSLTNLANVGRSFSLQGISEGVQNISNRFSALGIVGITVLQNLTNLAINLGKKAIEAALGIDQMKLGFSGYEVKINAIKTVMSGTGETIDEVTKSLDELNNYSDRTIYSFQDMTENISKFTNAGLSSKQAATAIQGISNVAAISGASTQDAARAMYNFGQAMQQGNVRLMDWKSIENANMATIGFKNQLLETAAALGTLKKEADGTYKTISGGEAVTATKNFNGSLEKLWLTTDVLNKTLADYASQETEIGKKANSAAQDVKTLSQLMATLQDSLKTGWTKTWQIVVGDLNESTALFTMLSNAIGTVTSESTNARLTALKQWKDLGGRNILIQSLTDSLDSVLSIVKSISYAFSQIFPPETGKLLFNITQTLGNLTSKLKVTWESSYRILAIFKGLFTLLKIGADQIYSFSYAFREIFPSGSKNIIDSITESLQWLVDIMEYVTSNFKMSWETSYKLLTIFKAFWAVIDIVRMAIVSLAKSFGSLLVRIASSFGGLEKIGGSLSNFAKNIFKSAFNISNYVLALRKSIKENDAFGKSFSKINDSIMSFVSKVQKYIPVIVSSFQKVISTIKPIFDKIKSLISNIFENIGSGGTDDFSDKMTKRFEPLKKLIEVLGKTFEWLGKILEKLSPIFFKLASIIGTGIKEIAGGIWKGLQNIDYNNLFDSINIGLIAALVLAIKKFLQQGTDVFGGITDILDGVKGSLTAWQESIKAKTLLTIAIAIAILAASLIALSFVDSDKLTMALSAITVMFAELMGSMEVFSKMPGGKGLSQVAAQMIAISASVLILAVAVSMIAKLDAVALTNGLIGIGVILAELAAFMKVTDLSGAGAGKATGLLLLAVAVNVLGFAVKKFSDLEPEKMKQGLLGIGIVLAELAAFTNLTGNSRNVISTAIGLTIIGAAMLIFEKAIEKMGNLSWEQITKGLVTMGGALLLVTAAVNAMPKNMLLSGIALTIVASALLIMSKALTAMGNMSWEEIGRGLVAMGGSLLVIAGAIRLMPSNMIFTSVGLTVVASALVILSKALSSMGGMTWDEISRGLTALAGSMLILVVALNAMTGTLPAAASIFVVSAALAVLAPSLKILGSMSLEEIGRGLLVLAGTFVILGVAGLVLGPIVPVIFSLAGALFLFGLAAIAMGVGVLAFSTGLAALAVSGTAGAAALVLIVTSIIGLIPLIVVRIGEALVALVTMIGNAAPAILAALTQILLAAIGAIVAVVPELVKAIVFLIETLMTAIREILPKVLSFIVEMVPQVVDALLKLITSILNVIAENIPKILQAGFDILLGILAGIRDNIGKIVTVALEIVTTFIDAVAKKIPSIIQSGVNLIVSFIDGLSRAIDNNQERINSAIARLAKSIIDGLVNGITAGIGAVASAVTGLAKRALAALGITIEANSPSDKTYEYGEFFTGGFIDGIISLSKKVEVATENIGQKAMSGLNNAISQISDAVNSNLDMSPTIRPVVDLTNIQNGSKQIDRLFGTTGLTVSASTSKLSGIVNGMRVSSNTGTQINQPVQMPSVSFTQNNYSPVALSRIEIYRQTRNQLVQLKGLERSK